MTNHILPLEAFSQPEATEHVHALESELRTKSIRNAKILPPLDLAPEGLKARSAQYVQNVLTDLNLSLGPRDTMMIISGLYGTQKLENGKSTLEIAKSIFPAQKLTTVVSTPTLNNQDIADQFQKHVIDYLAAPNFAFDSYAVGFATNTMLLSREERLIRMNGVPHLTAQAYLRDNRNSPTKTKGRVLPLLKKNEHLVVVALPGDVVDEGDHYCLFTPVHARAFAERVNAHLIPEDNKDLDQRHPTTMIIVTSSYTGKFGAEIYGKTEGPSLLHRAALSGVDPRKGIERNEVAKAFRECILDLAPSTRIVDACAAFQTDPLHAFAAMTAYVNKHAQMSAETPKSKRATLRGKSIFVAGIDNLSILSQASDVLDPNVMMVAADTPAKFRTHDLALRWFQHRHGANVLTQTGVLETGEKIDEPNAPSAAATLYSRVRQIVEHNNFTATRG